MPVSKNRRTKRIMKPRSFFTVKSARRYIRRFMWQFLANRKSNKRYSDTMTKAIKMAHISL